MLIKKTLLTTYITFFVPCPKKNLAMAENYQSGCIFLEMLFLKPRSLGGFYFFGGVT